MKTGGAAPPDTRATLWLMVAPPTLWAVHFLACYLTVAVWCARVAGRTGALGSARTAVWVYTVVALAGIVFFGWTGLRRHRLKPLEAAPHDEDTAGDRERFMGLAMLMLATLSGAATIYVALAAAFIGSCR